MKTSAIPGVVPTANAPVSKQFSSFADLRPAAQAQRQLMEAADSGSNAMQLKAQAAMLNTAPYKVSVAMNSETLPSLSEDVIQAVVVARVDFDEVDPDAIDPPQPKITAVTLTGRPNIPYIDHGGGGQGDHVVGYVLFEHAVQNAITGRTFAGAVGALKNLVSLIRELPGFAAGREADKNAREELIQGMEANCNQIINGTRVVSDINKPTVLAGFCETYLNARSSLRLVSRNSASNGGVAPNPDQVRLGARNLNEFIALDEDDFDKRDLDEEDIERVTSAMWATFDYRPTNDGNGRTPEDAANAVITLVMTTFQSYPDIYERWKWPIVDEIIKDFNTGEGTTWGWDVNKKKTFEDTVYIGLH
jgi:hypothetical protein